MSNLLKKQDKGFTLIEIVLVLAIAGLIMVIVFLAVSGAQKSRRDTQRKNDVGRIAAGLENYASNTNGSYPATQAAFDTAFKGGVAAAGGVPASAAGPYNVGNDTDPLSGKTYTYAGVVSPTSTVSAGVSYTLNSPRVYTVCIGLEQGASSCRTNQ